MVVCSAWRGGLRRMEECVCAAQGVCGQRRGARGQRRGGAGNARDVRSGVAVLTAWRWLFYFVIPRVVAESRKSELKSFHCGLFFSINAIFHALLRFFIFFSSSIAEVISLPD